MTEQPSLQRVTFSPSEFAALFGKSQTWGYRQIYAGKVQTITEYGRILIPASEVERILGSAARYEGRKPVPAKTKAEILELVPQLQSARRDFLAKRREDANQCDEKPERTRAPGNAFGDRISRRDALRRLGRKN